MATKKNINNIYSEMDFPPWEYQEFPRMMYHPEGVVSSWQKRRGEVIETCGETTHIVTTPSEAEAGLKGGWFFSPHEARKAWVSSKEEKPLSEVVAKANGEVLGAKSTKPASVAHT